MLQRLYQTEEKTLLWIQAHMRRTWLTFVMKCITCLGNGGVFWLTIALCSFWFPAYRITGTAIVLSQIFSVIFSNGILKNVIARPRPQETISKLCILIRRPRDFSFPSGHTSSSFAAAVILLQTTPLWLGLLSLIIAVLIAFSRLYLGVHFPSDVVCGAVLGIIFGAAALLLFRFVLEGGWLLQKAADWLNGAFVHICRFTSYIK